MVTLEDAMADPERFEIDLPAELAQFVHSQVGHNALASDSDVLREAVRQAAQREALKEATRQQIAAGIASLRAGAGVNGEVFMAALDADLAKQERQGR